MFAYRISCAERFNPGVTREKQNGINGRSSGSFRVNYRARNFGKSLPRIMKMETLRAIYHGTVGTGGRLYRLRPGVGHSVSRKFDLYRTRPTLDARSLLKFFRSAYGNRAIYNPLENLPKSRPQLGKCSRDFTSSKQRFLRSSDIKYIFNFTSRLVISIITVGHTHPQNHRGRSLEHHAREAAEISLGLLWSRRGSHVPSRRIWSLSARERLQR